MAVSRRFAGEVGCGGGQGCDDLHVVPARVLFDHARMLLKRTRAFALHLALLGVLVHAMSSAAAGVMSVAAAGNGAKGGLAEFWVICLGGQGVAAEAAETDGSPGEAGLQCPLCSAASNGVLPAPSPATGNIIPAVPLLALGPVRLDPDRVGFVQPPSRAPPGLA